MNRTAISNLFTQVLSRIFRVPDKTAGLAMVRLLIGAAIFISMYGTVESSAQAASPPSFSKDVAPIFKKNCIVCHSKGAHKSDLVLDTYENLMKGGKHGQAIVPQDRKS